MSHLDALIHAPAIGKFTAQLKPYVAGWSVDIDTGDYLIAVYVNPKGN